MSRPLQLIGVSLPPGAGPASRILAEVDRLQANRGVRVLDVLLVSKAADGTVMQSSFGGDEDFGELVSRLFPLDGGDAGGAPSELWGRAQALPADTAAAFLLVEHRWAGGIFDLVDEEGGTLLGAGFVTPELGLMIDAEITAMEEAARSITAAQDAEAAAWMKAAEAEVEAGETVAAAARIRSAAAAEVLRVLTDAGLIERAAAHEAADALSAAGLIIAAAEQAVDADESAVAAADEAAADAIAADEVAVTAADAKKADAVAAASVTADEIRVLNYLPTDLTFALIADRLGISRGAAKQRAKRAYKKLGVHNRADAVKRARTLGVIS